MEDRQDHFADTIETEAELEAVIGHPFQPAVEKVVDHLDPICRAYIARSPFLLIASADKTAAPELSPRGDAAGFVAVLDDHTIALPDRPGNRRADTFRRVLRNPEVALLFLVPGMGETLRVYGSARLVTSLSLRQRFAVNGRLPARVMVVTVERVMVHCPKCVIRSGLWDPKGWPSIEGLPTIGPVMKSHARLKGTQEDLDEEARRAGMLELY